MVFSRSGCSGSAVEVLIKVLQQSSEMVDIKEDKMSRALHRRHRSLPAPLC